MIKSLLNKIDEASNINKDVIIKAYNLANEAHKDQVRASGEPYVIHPIEVASILVDIGMDTNTVAAGLLHDVIEDTDYTYDDIKKEFGVEVADLVEGVTKLGKIDTKSKEEEQADNVRKMVLAMARDIRVVLIKLADRLHNMRTLRFKSPAKQREKAKECFDIYAPLAHRLGMFRIKWELEDLAFRYMYPTEYYDLVDQIAEKRREREDYIEKIIAEIQEKLSEATIEAEIDGRPKHFYSIYKKMNNKSKSLEQIFDLTAIRVIVDSIKDCYAALGIVHTIYKPIPGRFKDYIAMPKPNMYQSLHTTVIGPQGKPFEIQIRTFEMHKTAEYGIAAHWNYKESGGSKEQNDDEKLMWLRDMLEWQKETSDADEFMEGFKIDLFEDEVFVFTPKGRVVNLPSNATPIDFAYRIHTDIGNKTVGAKVNGNMVPLDYKLKTGEIVEVLTSNQHKGPNINWLNIVTSNQAKAKIRGWFKKEKREENIAKGKELLEKEAKKQDRNFADIAKGEGLEKLLKKYHGHSIEDLYAIVGTGQLAQSYVVSYFKEKLEEKDNKEMDREQERKTAEALIEENRKKLENRKDKKSKSLFGVTVTGMDNVEVRFAKCCNPLPGDKIDGFITNFRGISVHRCDCPNLKSLRENENADRFVKVEWQNNSSDLYSARIQIQATDRINLLTDVMQVFNDLKITISALNAENKTTGTSTIYISIQISSTDLLNEVIKRLRRVHSVIDVFRINAN